LFFVVSEFSAQYLHVEGDQNPVLSSGSKNYILLMLQEAPWDVPTNQPSNNWPENGQVEFKDYQLRYREGLDLVLRGISFTVKGGEKVS
jgi:ABC-type multidrug transport system fused ATPase/permease subunit